MPGARKNIYIGEADQTLLDRLAADYHGGNDSAAYSAALHAYVQQLVEREALIKQAVLDLAVAIEPSDQADPDDDTRAEGPHLLLAALLDEAAARAIEHALNELWLRWQMPAPGASKDDEV